MPGLSPTTAILGLSGPQPVATLDKVRWNFRNQKEYELILGRNAPIHSDYHHSDRPESMFLQELFLCQVVPALPLCKCPHEMVYTLSDDLTDIRRLLLDTLRHVSSERLFTSWGHVQWFSALNIVEEVPLTVCTLRPVVGLCDP